MENDFFDDLVKPRMDAADIDFEMFQSRVDSNHSDLQSSASGKVKKEDVSDFFGKKPSMEKPAEKEIRLSALSSVKSNHSNSIEIPRESITSNPTKVKDEVGFSMF